MRHVDDGTLNAWLDDALPPDDAAALRDHLDGCAECAARLEAARHFRSSADALLAAAAPGDLALAPFEAIRTRAATVAPRNEDAPVNRPARSRRLGGGLTLAWAASITVALAAGWWAREIYQPPLGAVGENGRVAPRQAARAGAPTSSPKEATPATAVTVPSQAAPAAAAPVTVSSPPAPARAGVESVTVPPDVPPPGPRSRGERADAPGRSAGYQVLSGARAMPAGPEQRAPARPTEADYAATGLEAGRSGARPADTVTSARPAAPPQALPADAVALQALVVTPVPAKGFRPEKAVEGLTMKQADARTLAAQVRDTAGAARPARLSGMTVRAENVEAAPTFTPYTVSPELKNREEVRLALVRFYPPMAKDAGLGGTTLVWALIDTDGKVAKTRIKASSGVAALDEAALRVAAVMRFSPGLNRDQPVKLWVQLPIVFKTTP